MNGHEPIICTKAVLSAAGGGSLWGTKMNCWGAFRPLDEKD